MTLYPRLQACLPKAQARFKLMSLFVYTKDQKVFPDQTAAINFEAVFFVGNNEFASSCM